MQNYFQNRLIPDLIYNYNCLKLFVYSYKPTGSKISIGNNRIYIQESTYIQGVLRKINGDTKNDITILMCPVLYACTYYLKNKEIRHEYIPIFKGAIEGLVNMKQTYSGTPIIYNIEHIINTIQMFLDENLADVVATDLKPKVVSDAKSDAKSEGTVKTVAKGVASDLKPIEKHLDPIDSSRMNPIINQNAPLYKIKENIYQHLNGSWTITRKNILFGYIKELTEATNTNNTSLKLLIIEGLTKFMDCMDTFVSNTLLNS